MTATPRALGLTLGILGMAAAAQAGLLAFYSFDNESAPFEDTSGLGNHITGTAGTDPVWGAALGYNGSGAYEFSVDRLVAPLDVNVGVMPQMTWGAWVRTNTIAPGLRKILGHDNGAWDRTIGLDNRTAAGGGGQPNNTTFRYTAFTGPNNNGPVQITPNSAAEPVNTTDWAFLAASYNNAAATMTFYVDLDATTTEPLSVTTTAATFGPGETTFAIGGISPANPGEPWDGAIDNVFIYNEVLDLAKITAIRNEGKDEILGLNITDPEIVVVHPIPLFGNLSYLEIPSSVVRTVTVRNDGAANTLNLDAPVLAGADQASYSVDLSPIAILPGEQAEIEVTLTTGGVPGIFVAELQLNSDDPVTTTVTIPLDANVGQFGLRAFFSFDNSSNPFEDSSGSGNHITDTAGTDPVWDAHAGLDGTGAYEFSADRLIVPIDVNVGVMPQMTWGAWVRTNSLASGLRKVLGHDNGAWDRTIGLDNRTAAPGGPQPDGATFRYTAFTGINNDGPLQITPNADAQPVSTTDWTFLAASYDQATSSMAFYVDLDASTSEPLSATTTAAIFGPGHGTFAIGGIRPDNANEPWDGAIDNVFLYDGVLDAAKVAAIRDRGVNELLYPGADPSIAVSPARLFGDLTGNPGGGTGPQVSTVTISNFGATQDLNLGALSISGPDQALYSFTPPVSPVAPGTSVTVEVTLIPPTAGGSFTATLGIPSDDANTPSVTVTLDAVVAPDPNISVSPLVLFGDLTGLGAAPGAIAQEVVIFNMGSSQDLHLGNLTITGADGGLYSLTPPLPTVVAPGADATVEVIFTPPAAGGVFVAALEIASDDFDTPLVTVTLDASVTTDPDFEVVAPDPLFGTLVYNVLPGSIARVIRVRNNGVVNALTLDPPVLSGPDQASFSVVAPATLAPGEEGEIVVTLDPAGVAGPYMAALQLASDDPDSSGITISLDAELGVVPPANLLAFYCFDNEADPFEDRSGNANHLSGVAGPGGPTYGAAVGYEGSGAYEFGGDGDRLIAPIDVQASVLPEMTWGAWVRTADLNSGLRKVMGHDNGAWDRTIGLDDRDGPFRYTSFTGIGRPAIGGPAPVSTTDWTFLAAAYSQSSLTVTVYVDLDASTTADPLVSASEPADWAGNPAWNTFSIGSIRPDADSEGWNGGIDNVFVYDGLLTTEQLQAIRAGKNAILPPPAATPILFDVTLNAAQNTGTLFFLGLQVGQTYHVLASIDGVNFGSVPGSEFVAATEDQSIQLPVDIVANPLVIVKGAVGSLPLP